MSENRSSAHASRGPHAVVLFDGVCNLCSGAVNFIIDHDPGEYFHFGTLQSAEAAAMLASAELPLSYRESLVLFEQGRWYVRSTAALRIARKLGGIWPLFYGLILLPRPLRDAVYDFVAAHRYHWFGRRETCRIPTPELKQRFL